jgi:hypothetical protein
MNDDVDPALSHTQRMEASWVADVSGEHTVFIFWIED